MNIFEETYRKEQEMVRQFDATDDEEEEEEPEEKWRYRSIGEQLAEGGMSMRDFL